MRLKSLHVVFSPYTAVIDQRMKNINRRDFLNLGALGLLLILFPTTCPDLVYLAILYACTSYILDTYSRLD